MMLLWCENMQQLNFSKVGKCYVLHAPRSLTIFLRLPLKVLQPMKKKQARSGQEEEQATHSQFLLPGVGGERLWLQEQSPARPQMSEHLPEGSAEAGIAPVEVDPLGETESQNHVILWTHTLHLWL